MKQAGLRAPVLVHQSKGRAGDIFLGSGVEALGYPLNQRRLARAEVTAKKHYLGRRQLFGEQAAQCNGFVGGMSEELLRGHATQYSEGIRVP